MSSKTVGEAKKRAYDDMYDRLGTKERENDICKITKVREQKTRDLSHIKCVKDEDDRVLIQDKAILNKWNVYF